MAHPLFDVEAHKLDCALKCLNDTRVQFYGWTQEQVEDSYEHDGNLAEKKALQMAMAIVKERERQDEFILDPELETPSTDVQRNETAKVYQAELFPQTQQIAPSAKYQQPAENLKAALPMPPEQTQKQKLQSSTILTPPSIVSPNFDKPHKGINWPHYENILKLYALGVLYKGELTRQQQQDKKDLEKAIEYVYRIKHPRARRHKFAKEIVEKACGRYIQYGKNIISALNITDEGLRASMMYDLEEEISKTHNPHNARQLDKTMHKSRNIVTMLRKRYQSK